MKPVSILPHFTVPFCSLRAEKKRSSVKVSIGETVIFCSFMPFPVSWSLFTSFRSMWGYIGGCSPTLVFGIHWVTSSIWNPALQNWSSTSVPTSKLSCEMPGPMAAVHCSGLVP